MTAKTDANVLKATEQAAKLNQLNATPKPTGPALEYVNAYRNRVTASAFTPKRKRSNSPDVSRQKPQFPPAKMGTKSSVNGLSVVKPNRNRDDEPEFKKALYVSGLHPTTSNGELADYIVQNTSVNDKTEFNVHKMVKKDADLSVLRFVSFKVEMNDDEFWMT